MQPGIFWVQDASGSSENEQAHTVSFGDTNNLPSCDCHDWLKFKLPCKHMCSVFSSFPDWGWDMLNINYTANALFNLDFSCIKPWIDSQQTETSSLAPENIVNDTDSGKMVTVKLPVATDPYAIHEHGENDSDSTRTDVSSFFDKMDVANKTHPYQQIESQCRDLLQNLTRLSQNISINNAQLERLKTDLQLSIGIFSPIKNCQLNKQVTVPAINQLTNSMHIASSAQPLHSIASSSAVFSPSLFTNNLSTAIIYPNKRSVSGMSRSMDEVPRKKNATGLHAKESSLDGSFLSDDDVSTMQSGDTDIEDETIEITTEPSDMQVLHAALVKESADATDEVNLIMQTNAAMGTANEQMEYNQ